MLKRTKRIIMTLLPHKMKLKMLKKQREKRTGENHTHCHCPLFKVTDSLLEFMGSGQPSRRFKADQLKRNEARKVDQAVRLQKQKLDRIKYEGDIKKE